MRIEKGICYLNVDLSGIFAEKLEGIDFRRLSACKSINFDINDSIERSEVFWTALGNFYFSNERKVNLPSPSQATSLSIRMFREARPQDIRPLFEHAAFYERKELIVNALITRESLMELIDLLEDSKCKVERLELSRLTEEQSKELAEALPIIDQVRKLALKVPKTLHTAKPAYSPLRNATFHCTNLTGLIGGIECAPSQRIAPPIRYTYDAAPLLKIKKTERTGTTPTRRALGR